MTISPLLHFGVRDNFVIYNLDIIVSLLEYICEGMYFQWGFILYRYNLPIF